MKSNKSSSTPIMLGTGGFFDASIATSAYEILDHYIELGGNSIDTARAYGASESILGEWMAVHRCRDNLLLLSKGGHPNNTEPQKSRLSREELRQDISVSLDALKTDYVDAYALHRDDESRSVKEIMESLHRLVTEGLTKRIGVSNWNVARIAEANRFALDNDLTPITFNSPGYSLADANIPRWPGCRMLDESSHAWHCESQLPVLAWSPQASGFFSGKYSPSTTPNSQLAKVYVNEQNWKRLERCQQLATNLGTSATAVALAYVLAQPFPISTIVGASKKRQLDDAFEATTLNLTQQQCDWLTS